MISSENRKATFRDHAVWLRIAPSFCSGSWPVPTGFEAEASAKTAGRETLRGPDAAREVRGF